MVYMESVWGYIMRRKPIFLGYFAIFLASIFASYGFLNSILPKSAIVDSSVIQETPPQPYGDVLSPAVVAGLASPEAPVSAEPPSDTLSEPSGSAAAESSTPQNFIQVNIANPSPPVDPTQPAVDVPLTNTPEESPAAAQVSVVRTILAVLLAVAALTLAGLGLYQTYNYFAPFIDDRCR